MTNDDKKTGRLVKTSPAYPATWKVKLERAYRGQTRIAHTNRISQAVRDKAEKEFDVIFEIKNGKADNIRLSDENVDVIEEQEKRTEEARQKNSTTAQPVKQRKKPSTRRPDGDFHNPYNFIPAPKPSPQTLENSLLGHSMPVGHSAYHADKWSGRIGIRMTTVTPLLILDSANVVHKDNGHLIFGMRKLGDGPYFPPTSFKGPLRSAFEAITNSRLGVLEQHNDPLAHRMPPGDGLAMIPARISQDGKKLELWQGTTRKFPQLGGNKKWSVPSEMYAAWLPRYRRGTNGLAPWAARYSDGTYPEHGDEVYCWLEKIKHSAPPFTYWRVRQICKKRENLSNRPPRPSKGFGKHQPLGAAMIRARGWVCITNQNISMKHDERVFFVPEDANPTQVELTEALEKSWKLVVKNYQKIHEDDLKKRGKNNYATYQGGGPGQAAFSRHIYEKDAEKLKGGDLCYVRVDKDGNFIGLYPVMIGRELAKVPPIKLLPEQLHPAEELKELSPADRVFGWVSNNKGSGTYKGQLRVGPVKCETPDAIEQIGDDENGLPLAILSTAKPQQARFYVSETQKGEAQYHGFSKDDSDYAIGRGLRGRKVFPHQALTAGNDKYWDGPNAFNEAKESQAEMMKIGDKTVCREYIRRDGKNGNQTDQNRSIREWVKPGTDFVTWIDVINLNEAELGALLWLCHLPDDYCHRMGSAKPLGFGSVRLEIENVCLANGKGKREYYSTLGPRTLADNNDRQNTVTEIADCTRFIDTFKETIAACYGNPFEQVSFIKAFEQAAKGVSKPVHYPRGNARPDPDEENFKWFVNNENTRFGLMLTLDDLSDDAGLPYSPTKSKPKHQDRRPYR